MIERGKEIERVCACVRVTQALIDMCDKDGDGIINYDEVGPLLTHAFYMQITLRKCFLGARFLI